MINLTTSNLALFIFLCTAKRNNFSRFKNIVNIENNKNNKSNILKLKIMKIKSLLVGMLASLALVGCTSEDEV